MEKTIHILKTIWDVIIVIFHAMKSKIVMVILVVLVIVGGFTYISYRNYVDALPIVSLTDSIQNAIRIQTETTGTLYYNEILDVVLPQGCHVEEVFVSEGDTLEANSPLLRIKVADLQVVRLEKQLQIELLETVEEEGGTEGELAYWKKELLLEEMAELKKLIAAEGVVKVEDSTVNSVCVIKQIYKNGDVTNTDVPITLGLPEGGCYIEWQISAKEYKDYKGTVRIGNKKENLICESPKYVDGIYTYQSQIPMPENFVNGGQVKIELNYVSDEYEAVLPRNCIRMDTDGSTYVFQVSTRKCNYGEEKYVRKYGVTIIEQDAVNVAVKGRISNVVLGSSMQLQDMMAVMIIEN